MLSKLKLTSLLTCFACLSSHAQIQETFEELEKWQGEKNKFSLQNSHLRLSDSSSSGKAYLSIPSEIGVESIWEIDFEMLFSPSSSNRLELFLMSDNIDPSFAKNAYLISIGENGSNDALEFYKLVNGQKIKIGRGIEARFADQQGKVKLRVERNASNEWTILSKLAQEFDKELTIKDSSIVESNWFCIQAHYTVTRSNAFLFDNLTIIGKKYIDSIPPKLVGIEAINNTSVRVIFSEAINTNNPNILINGHQNHTFVWSKTQDTLYLKTEIKSEINHFEINGIEDNKGNKLAESSYSFKYMKIEYGDILFSEIMADPSPSIGLPLIEFIELYNPTNEKMILKNWLLADLTDTIALPIFEIEPLSYKLLIPESDPFFNNIFTVLVKDLITLNNESDHLKLFTSDTTLIHQIKYNLESYQDKTKQNGGWSIELQNTENQCLESVSWSASITQKGGTPGQKNSIINKELPSQNLILVWKNENQLSIKTDAILNIFSTPSITWNTEKIDFQLSEKEINIDLSTIKKEYNELKISKLKLCNGKILDSIFEIRKLEKISSGDVYINEILFNPLPNHFDYLEIYNSSEKSLDLNGLCVVSRDYQSGQIKGKVCLEKSLPFDSKSYFIFTENSTQLSENYLQVSKNQLFQFDLPSFNDESGIIILEYEGKKLDSLYYNENMHADFIKNREGISLEKIDETFDSNKKENWYSASSTDKFGTPTRKNSASYEKTDQNWDLKPTKISPDGDGMDDVAFLNYENITLGTLIDVSIFDANGFEVKKILNNESISGTGIIKIEGTIQNRTLSPGIYVLALKLLNTQDGTSEIKKWALVVNQK